MNCAQETFAAADREVVNLLQNCHDEAMELLRENRELLDKIAEYLFKKETITGAQMMAIIEDRDPDAEEYYGVKGQQDAAEIGAKVNFTIDEPIPMPDEAAEEPVPAEVIEEETTTEENE